MNHYVMDHYIKSQGIYRLEFLEWQVAQDASFQEKDLSLDRIIRIANEDGYEALQDLLNSWLENSAIAEEDVLEYLFMKAHPELFPE